MVLVDKQFEVLVWAVERLPGRLQTPAPCKIRADLVVLFNVVFRETTFGIVSVARICQLVDLACADPWVQDSLHHFPLALNTHHLAMLDYADFTTGQVHQHSDVRGELALRVGYARGVIGYEQAQLHSVVAVQVVVVLEQHRRSLSKS